MWKERQRQTETQVAGWHHILRRHHMDQTGTGPKTVEKSWRGLHSAVDEHSLVRSENSDVYFPEGKRWIVMHARWDFDALNAWTLRVNVLDKHRDCASALFCRNFQAQSKYTVINLVHTWHKQTFSLLYVIDKIIRQFTKLKKQFWF